MVISILLQLRRKFSGVFRHCSCRAESWTEIVDRRYRMGEPTSITADELNVIIQRYLQKSGFKHTAYSFNFESGISHSPIVKASVPPEALIDLMVMGLQHKELLANYALLNEDDDFIFLPTMDLITKDVTVLQEIVMGKLGKKNVAGTKDSDQGQEGARSREIVKDDNGNKNVAGPSDSGKRHVGVSNRGKNKVRKAPETLQVPVKDQDEVRKQLKRMYAKEKAKATRKAFFH